VGHTVFPLVISAIQLAPEGHAELVIARAYSQNAGPTMAGRVLLSPAEAIALADELRCMVEPDSHTQPSELGHA
jgi:hypothetical protein